MPAMTDTQTVFQDWDHYHSDLAQLLGATLGRGDLAGAPEPPCFYSARTPLAIARPLQPVANEPGNSYLLPIDPYTTPARGPGADLRPLRWPTSSVSGGTGDPALPLRIVRHCCAPSPRLSPPVSCLTRGTPHTGIRTRQHQPVIYLPPPLSCGLL